jgi:hypothetical protein
LWPFGRHLKRLTLVLSRQGGGGAAGVDAPDLPWATLLTQCPHLEVLTLNTVGTIVEATNAPVCPLLHTLDIGGCTIADPEAVLRSVPNLAIAEWGFCYSMHGAGVLFRPALCPRLKRLGVAGGADDSVLAALGQYCPDLEYLQAAASDFPRVTDAGVRALVSGCHNLNALGLGGQALLTVDSLQSLRRCRALAVLDVSGCAGMKEGAEDVVDALLEGGCSVEFDRDLCDGMDCSSDSTEEGPAVGYPARSYRSMYNLPHGQSQHGDPRAYFRDEFVCSVQEYMETSDAEVDEEFWSDEECERAGNTDDSS